MNKYHIYGIGNALVDVEIEVKPEDLAELSIEKGLMTLVDKDRHDYLNDKLPGERHKRACGGSAANTVIGAAKLGAKSFYVCKIANDETGSFYADDLHREGVDSNLSGLQLSDGHTGKCLVMVTPDADRTMNTFLGITGDVGYKEVDEAALKVSEWLYLEGYLVSSEQSLKTALKAIEFAQGQNIKVAISFSDPSMVKFCREGVQQLIANKVDLLFCNLEEALLFTGAEELDTAFTALKQYAHSFAITLGAEGSRLWDGYQTIEIDAFQVTAVDTNGAGDLFAGAFLYGITHNLSFAQSGKLASYASSLLVTEFQPRLSNEGLQKVQQFLQESI